MKALEQAGFAAAALLVAALLAQMIGCGGGGFAAPPPPPPAPPLTITTTSASLLTPIVGNAYSQTLQATGGTPPYTWSLEAGSPPLPPGLNLSSAGVISGTPDPVRFSGAAFTFFVTVQDSAARTARQQFFITVTTVLTVRTNSLPNGNVGISYQESLFADGGAPALVWSLASGSAPLPAGLTLNSNGNILGVPTAFGSFSFTVQVTDMGNPPQKATGTVSLNIANKLIIALNNFSFPVGVVSRLYSATLTAVGGATPYTWSLASGNLPAGVTLSSSGQVSGTPTASGNFFFTVQVTDSSPQPQIATAELFLQIQPVPSIQNTSLLDGIVGSSYSGTIFILGGISPFQVTVTSGTLPDGMSVPTGPQPQVFFLPGAPSRTGTFNFTLQVADSSSPPLMATKALSIRVVTQLVFPAPTLPNGLQGQAYNLALVASGGVQPYTWSIPAGSFPTGLRLDSATGIISGTPTQVFNDFLDLELVDSSNPPQQIFRLPRLIIVGILSVATTSLPPLRPGVPLNITLGVSGGIGPFAWSVSSGSLPNGLTLDPATGNLQGTVAAETTANITVKINDPGPPAQTATRPLALTFKSALGRNDTVATATPLSNGAYTASISPPVDPATSSTPNPDVDVYQIAANPGAIVTIETRAQRLHPPSRLDTVIEIVDSSGQRLNICGAPFLPFGSFNSPCMNDDIFPGTTDSALGLQVPTNASGPLTFFVRVLDFTGSARPDFLYTMTVTGAN